MKSKTYLLGDICKFIDYRGKTPPKTTSGVPLVTAKIVKNGVIQKPQEFIAENYYDEWMRRGIPKKGSVVFTTEAPLGEVAQIKTNAKLAFAQRIIVLEPNQEYLDETYLFYALQDSVLKSRIDARASGTTVIGIKAAELKKVEIDVPSLSVQQKIAGILSVIDSKIALNNKINDNLEQQARLALNHWIEEHSAEYELLPLSDVATVNDDIYSPKEQWPFVNYLDTSSITDGAIAALQYIVPSIDKLPSRARRKITSNDVVFSTVRPNQHHFGIIKLPVPNMLVSTGFAVIRSKVKEICNELIYLRLTENSFIEAMQQLAEQSTSTFPSIKPSDLYQCEIPYPIDNKLTEILESMFSIIAANQKENEALSQLRDTLLPKLMVGEIDLI